MKQVSLIVIATIAILALIPITYKLLHRFLDKKSVGTFDITFDDKLLHSNLYPPKNLSIKKIGNDQVQISWNFDNNELIPAPGVAPEYAILSGFRIYKDGYWHKDVSATDHSFTDGDIYPNENYRYSVSALTFDNKIEGLKSGEVKMISNNFALNPVQFPVNDIKTYLAEGDSITAAANVSPGLGWAELTNTFLNQHGLNVKLYNKGVTGSTAATVDDRISQELIDIDPDLVTIAVGVNDIFGASRDIGNISMSEYADHLKSIIKKARAGRARDVVVLNIFYINCCSDKRQTWDKEVRDIANEYGVLFIDVSKPMTEDGGQELLAGDLHPNSVGHKVIADTVINSLKNYINK